MSDTVSKVVHLLSIVAQPMPSYRERYLSETNPSQNHPLRFIRAAQGENSTYHYPTVEVSVAVCFLACITFFID